ncbi:MAG: mechanosensitive ion channel [Christensenellaceae bacterium]|jgi:small conductance mechanosensitive channel|nr:mechanosensitive ion channel [Christensenellaceae bacterium]
MEKLKDILIAFAKGYGTNILEAIAVLCAGLLFLKIFSSVFKAAMAKTNAQGTTISFFHSLLLAILSVILFFLVINALEIDLTSVVTLLAAGGLAVGIALQNSFANLASGVILLVTKPFKENDFIEVGGYSGKVKKIRITVCEILTSNNKLIIVPNSILTSKEIINHSAKPTRRLDMTVSATYEADCDTVKGILLKIATDNPLVLDCPPPLTRANALKESGVEYLLRVWCNNEDYSTVEDAFAETVLKAFKDAGLAVAYNRLSVLNAKEVEDVK